MNLAKLSVEPKGIRLSAVVRCYPVSPLVLAGLAASGVASLDFGRWDLSQLREIRDQAQVEWR